MGLGMAVRACLTAEFAVPDALGRAFCLQALVRHLFVQRQGIELAKV